MTGGLDGGQGAGGRRGGAPKGRPPSRKALAKAELDGSKGVVMSFRPWDGQLRQPLLLGDGQAWPRWRRPRASCTRRTTLDTLGADAPEKLCKAR
jgi:hypothetical protein